MSDHPPTFRSRWGFYPCDFATYRKLKFLNFLYERAIRQAHAWERWQRKEPQNRVCRRRTRNDQGQTIGYEAPVAIAEPDLCPVFSRKVQERRFVDKRGAYFPDGFLVDTIVTDGSQLVTDYTVARKPMADALMVRPLRCGLTEIDAWYEKARAWLEQQDRR